MPVGYVLTTLVFAVCVAFAVRAPHPQGSRPWRLSFWFAYLVNELPIQALVLLAGITVLAAVQGDLFTPGGAIGAGIAVLVAVGLVVIARRGLRARAAMASALAEGIPGAEDGVAPRPRLRRWSRIVGWPFPWWFCPDIVRHADISYGTDARHQTLDVFQPAHRQPEGPVLVYFHGGAFRIGRKNLEARPLINRLVRHGWICISANYRLGRHARFPDHLVDAKLAIAWAKEHATDFGADPAQIHLAGSSAGGHLAATAGLTANDPRFQPGFEAVDTTAVAVIVLYGYFGSIATVGPPSSPHDYLADARPPPFAIVHGDQDTLVVVEDARAFAAQLRSVSEQPVVYAELPGAHHDFDLFHSIRFEAVLDGLETFAGAVASRTRGRR